MTTEEYRKEYRAIRKRSHAQDHATFDAAVRAILPADPTPKDYVAAARKVTFPCRRCAGTGQFITRVENGRPVGPGGICYRCEGKGRRNDADERRNYGHDLHYMARALGGV